MDAPFNLIRFAIELIVDYEGTKKKIEIVKKIPKIVDKINNKKS